MRLLLATSLFFLSGCSALDSLIFHPIHKVWSDRQAEKDWQNTPEYKALAATNSPAT